MEHKEKKHSRVDDILRWSLHWMERIIAVITMVALAVALGLECLHMLNDGFSYFSDISHLLHNLLALVVGLEFVRMLIDTTPANIIEVLLLAITRHVVLSHEDPWSNLVSILCIAILFAVRRHLIRREELQEELIDET